MAKFLFTCFLLLVSVIANTNSVWDYAPDFSNDPFPPYPPVKNPDGTNISVANARGTRLFGWKGCGSPEQKMITEAYDDFHVLVNQPGVYSNIDWNSKVATDFWGPTSGKNTIQEDTRQEIQRRCGENHERAVPDTHILNRDICCSSANVLLSMGWLGTALVFLAVTLG